MSAAPPRDASMAALAILFGTVFINLVGFGVVVPLMPFFAQSLKAEPWQITLLFSAYSAGQFFAEPFWGRLSDRIGRKPVLMATTALNAMGYVALAFAPDVWIAIAVRFATGLGGGNISAIQGYVADVTPPERRAGRMGLLGAAFGFGFIVGPSLGGLLARPDLGHLGFQIPLFVAAGLAATASLCVTLFVRESRARAAPGAPRARFLAGLRDAAANPVVSRVLLVMFLYAAAFSGMESSFGLWAEARFGWGPKEVGLAFGVVGVVAAFSQALVAGRLARAIGEARTLTLGLILFGSSLALQTFNTVAWAVPVVMAVGAFGMSLAMPNVSALISRSTSPDRQGAMLGLNMASGSAARIMGPVVAGQLFSHVGPNAPYLLGAVLAVPAAWMAINAGRAFKRMQGRAGPAPAAAE